MALTKWVRGSSWRTRATYMSSNSYVDCSGNIASLSIEAPNGTTYMTGITGQHVSTGVYQYYISTQSTDDLGIYICSWKSWFDYEHPWNYSPKVENEEISLVLVK